MTRRLDELRLLKARVDRELARAERAAREGARRRRRPAEHGTDSGFIRHHRKGIPFPEDDGGEPCGCREAHAAYERSRSQRKRSA